MSNLINKTGLQKFATKLWAKIKDRYDDAFVNAEIPATEKKITFTRANSTTKDVSLEKYARLQDRNKFEKDVSVDDADFYNNSSLGDIDGTVNSAQRTLGARNLTSKMFTDGFVSTLRIHLDNSHTGSQMRVHLWEIKKRAEKQADRTMSKLKDGESFAVKEVDGQKYVDVPINKEYADDIYFLFRSGDTAAVKAIRNIPSNKANDVMNLVDTTPPTGADQALDLRNQIETETAYVEIFGRIGIVDLNKKIEKVSADSSLYVKHTDCINGTEQGDKAGKVVKLGADGKLHSSLMPAIALNEFFPVTANTWNEAALNNITYQNGDIIYHTNTQKRYLCINKNASFEDRFVELNSKDGVVQSVNGKVGAVELNLEATDDKFKLKISGTGGEEVVKEIPMISEQEITEILDSLPQ
ncbi:hypothetical protein [uncultured Clostridium sp.]|uniref:hypothetical protein n=1 Tax=uncultured Clostridium sp. TaxID=59620 RepID=UPI00206EF592|nr:hypothetical protein [uncultured Clostridium sp.]DAP98282.1 MAG TPA: hypothetical protein [Caudoviricetes sp.]